MIDFDTVYRHSEHVGVAWRALHYKKVRNEDFEWTGIESEDRDWVVCYMIGDDREFELEVDELTEILEEDYCPECGQIGCKAYANE